MPNSSRQTIDDSETSGNLKRINDLEEFRREFEGEKFYGRVVDAFQKSKEVDAEVRKLVWCTIKDKLVWIVLTLLAVIFWDVLKEVAVQVISKLH